MAKGDKANCAHCGKYFIQKNSRHKYCSDSHRKMHHRKRNGIAEPEFLSQRKSVGKPYELISSNEVMVRTPDAEIAMIESQIVYYEQIVREAGAGVLPLWMLGLAGAGAIAGKGQFEKIGFALVGGFVGSAFDAKRKQNIVATAQKNLRLLKKHRKEAKSALKIAKMNLKSGFINQPKKGLLKTIGTTEYKTKNIPTIGIDKNSQYHYLFGDPSANFMMLLHGLPGNGKSTFCIQLADYFKRKHGDVLYIASEQKGLNRSFQDLLNKYVTTDFDISNNAKDHNFKSINKAANQYSLVILDSVNHLGITAIEFEKIRENAPKTAFIAIMQSVKDGNFKGSQEWAHNCDIIVEMKNMVANQTKSRFAPPSHIRVNVV